MPCSMGTSKPCCKPVWHSLSFSSSDDENISMVDIPSPSSSVLLQNPVHFPQQPHSRCTLTICADQDDDEEEDFQTVSLEDNNWIPDKIPDRHFCIHEHSAPHLLCPYPCWYMDYTSSLDYDTLDLSDISEFEDLMTTCSDKFIPALDKDVGYRSLWTMVSKWTFTFNLHL